MKRLVSMILVVALLLSIATISVSADWSTNDPAPVARLEVTGENEAELNALTAGQKVKVKLIISGLNVEWNSIQFQLNYDNDLFALDLANGTAVNPIMTFPDLYKLYGIPTYNYIPGTIYASVSTSKLSEFTYGSMLKENSGTELIDITVFENTFTVREEVSGEATFSISTKGTKPSDADDTTYQIGFTKSSGYSIVTTSTDDLTERVNVVKANSMTISGADTIEVPKAKDGVAQTKTENYLATVIGADGKVVESPTISWVIEGASTAVKVANGDVSVPSSAAAGQYTIKATATKEANTELSEDVTAETIIRVTKEDAEAVSISIQKSGQPVATDSIAIPQTGTNTASYSAVVKDQYGATMENQDIKWTLTPDGQASSQGVSVDKTGTVTVIPNATKGTYTLTAACSGKSATVNLTVVGITFSNVRYSTTGNPVYGNKWNQIVTNITGTAKIGNQVIEGTFTVNDAEGIPDAGTQQFYIVFNSNDESYQNVIASMEDSSVTISPKPVTVSGITAKNKEYDGNDSAEFDCSDATITGKVGEDELTVASATGTFENENVGTNKTVTITNITLGGVDRNNYTVAENSQNTTSAAITAREVTVSGITAADKVYDGNTTATLD